MDFGGLYDNRSNTCKFARMLLDTVSEWIGLFNVAS